MQTSDIVIGFWGTLPAEASAEIYHSFDSNTITVQSGMDAIALKIIFSHISIKIEREMQHVISIPAILGQNRPMEEQWIPAAWKTTVTASVRPGVDLDAAERWLGLYLDKVTGGKVLVSHATERGVKNGGAN